MTEFTQLYLTPKILLMGSSLAFNLKEDPVRCAKVCDKSWVILWAPLTIYMIDATVSETPQKKDSQHCISIV